MKKILFSLIASSAIFYSVNAQTKISFEASEGYNVGAVGGQKTWTAWGGAPANKTVVSTTKASDGARSVRILGDGAVEAYYGVESTISFYNRSEISFAINADSLDGSDNFVIIYNEDYDIVAGVDFDWDGNVLVYDYTEGDFVESSKTFLGNRWYNVKIEMDFATKVANYYVDSSLIATNSIDPTLANYSIVDLMTDDYGSGFYVDNIEVRDTSLISTSEVSKKDIFRVYPNPTVDVVNFDVAGKINSVEVYDAAGKLVKTTKDGAKSLNVSALSKGSYVVKVQTENGSHTQKLIKK
ncbi:T9SS type A sorting domain-containing protein [Chryseobacterium sp. FH1]|uniref:T9SS type A sorting domain-containing protein n=1 Tax=Chryseobacterium sp. FH1 TaxID=1233951 RepID=UPI0004E2FE58|nr:T9SS type A sorting domain-containing protein [Chryseobacterium sp. FH1]KFC21590.1 hypothetical protein IO90_06400 [Chryseobacterium sp. FH1]